MACSRAIVPGGRAGRAVLAAAALLLAAPAARCEPVTAPADSTDAEHARLAAQSLLIALAAAGERLVAVGDRGVVVRSDDKGGTWVQAEAVPTRVLLTGVCFFDAGHGLAVGHDEVILATADGGRTWKRNHYAPEAQQPLLDVWCGAQGRAIAIGAYGTYLTSADGGGSWTAGKFTPIPRVPPAPKPRGAHSPPAPAPATRAPDEDKAAGGSHLNRLVAATPARLYIAAEAGHLYRSDDAGASWRELVSPYHGSFFGVLPLDADALLAFGLRGNLYRSEDAGASWQKIETGTVQLLDGAARFGAAGVAVVGLSGVVLVSRDGGHAFTLQQQPDYTGLSAVTSVGGDEVAAGGAGGSRVHTLAARPAAVTGAH
ncbi:MAG: YCF48-related protein [Steroidobacteraceae bacterium]